MKNPASLENLNQKTWDEHYQKEKARQKYPDENLVRMLGNLRRGAALDFGCGSGRHIALLHELGFSPIYGTDISQNAVEMCRKDYAYAGLFKSNLPSSEEFFLPFPDEYFDLIVAWGVLHYNGRSSLETILEEFKRILKNGATFVGTLRSTNDTHFVSNPDMEGSEILYFTEEEAKELIGAHFHDVQLGYMERIPLGENRKVCHWCFRAKNIC